MKKTHNRFDPEGIDAWTRKYLGIPDDMTTSEYLVANGFSSRTVEGKIKQAQLSVASLEPKITFETQHLFIEMKSIIDSYEHAFKTHALTDIDEVKMEKAHLLYNAIELVRHALPAINVQKGYQKIQSERASKPRKLTESQHARIASQYSEGKKNGEGYGLAKSLAAHYNVSTTTIHAIVKKSENNRKKIK